MRRPTIQDVAARAKVTPAAVSFALNGQPGVSEETRRRVVQIAHEIDYRPNRAAKALSSGRAGAFGLVIDRPARSIGTEPFFMQFIAGVQSRLSAPDTGVGLLLRMASDVEAETAIYRDWWAGRHVDGVLLVNVLNDDPRWPVVKRLGMPAVVMGQTEDSGLWSIGSDEEPFIRVLLEYLRDLGHRRIARVSGPMELRHSTVRTTIYERLSAELGLTIQTVVGDYGRPEGIARSRELLTQEKPPTAIVYDNDITALAGLETAAELGISVPDDLSIVSWDDSPLCELVTPRVTALYRDVVALGENAAEALLAVSAGAIPENIYNEERTLIVRGSTGPAPQEKGSNR